MRMVAVKMYRAIFPVYFVTLFISILGTEHVPVLIWESGESSQREIPTPPFLTKLSSDDFSDYFMKKVPSHNSETKPVIAVFIEENLSIEDFSWEDVQEHDSFPQLENLASKASKVDFLPSVHAPLKGLKRLGYRWKVYHSINDTGDSLPNEGGVVLLVRLGDAKVEENRPDFLRRHDHTISDIYSDLLAKHPYMIGLYTSRHSSWVEPNNEPSIRRVRDLAVEEAAPIDNAIFWHDKDNSIFLYTPVYPTLNTNSSDPTQAINLTGGECTGDDRTNWQRLIVRITIPGTPSRKVVLRIIFPVSYSDYWSLSEVEYLHDNGTMIMLRTFSDIHAPVGFSYHCGSEIVFRNGSITLNFTNVQIQPYLKEPKFGDSYDCVWFFTVPIWSGLFVTAFLAFIMIWGLTMILDIKTMDRFDDPKGKTVTINATE